MNPLAALLIRNVIPYPDPLRRRRLRRQVRCLVLADPWPGDEATSLDIAQLALLRLLWLQRETHRASATRQFEALALLARAAIETCLLGLYSLYIEDAPLRLRSGNARALQQILAYLAVDDPVLSRVVDDVAEAIAPPKALPPLKHIAVALTTTMEDSFATNVYERIYVPLSTFSAHATGIALLRHVGQDDQLRDRPTRVWFRRSAVHSTDASVARLALAIAEQVGVATAPFAQYADVHGSRTIAPIVAISGQSAARRIRWSAAPPAVRALVKLRHYYRDGLAERQPYETRKSETRRSLDVILRVVDISIPADYRELLLESTATGLAGTAARDSTETPL
jgi:hypothetical protein